jgi:hypothetical protein
MLMRKGLGGGDVDLTLERLAKTAVIPWVAFWSCVALDSAVAYRRSTEAIDKAIDSDPIAELYDGPPEQHGQIKRWLMWGPSTLGRLREVRQRAKAWMVGAPVAAVVGAPVLLALAHRLSRPADPVSEEPARRRRR